MHQDNAGLKGRDVLIGHDKIGQVGFPGQAKFFTEPVTADLDAPGGDIHQDRYLLARYIHAEVSTQF